MNLSVSYQCFSFSFLFFCHHKLQLFLRSPLGLNFSTLLCKWSQFLWEEIQSFLIYSLILTLATYISHGSKARYGDNVKSLPETYCFSSWVEGGKQQPQVFSTCPYHHRTPILQAKKMTDFSILSGAIELVPWIGDEYEKGGPTYQPYLLRTWAQQQRVGSRIRNAFVLSILGK